MNFFTAFIVNNKNSLCSLLNNEDFRKNKDSSAAYGKRVYEDHKFAIISANMPFVINHIATLDIRLINIFQSTYVDERLVYFLDNAFADKGNFFHDYYCSIFGFLPLLFGAFSSTFAATETVSLGIDFFQCFSTNLSKSAKSDSSIFSLIPCKFASVIGFVITYSPCTYSRIFLYVYSCLSVTFSK